MKFEEIPTWVVQLVIGVVLAAILAEILKLYVDKLIEEKEAA